MTALPESPRPLPPLPPDPRAASRGHDHVVADPPPKLVLLSPASARWLPTLDRRARPVVPGRDRELRDPGRRRRRQPRRRARAA